MNKIYEYYYNVMSREYRKEIVGYEKLKNNIELPVGADRNTAIKVNFRNGSWIRCYRIGKNIEWY